MEMFVSVLLSLLGKGADVNALDKNGLTALHFAVRGNGSEKMVRSLVDRKSVNVVDKTGKTALDHLVCSWFCNAMDSFTDRPD